MSVTKLNGAEKSAKTASCEFYSHPFSRSYWIEAVKQFKNPRILVAAAVLIAVRVAIKSLSIPVGPGLFINFGLFVNALGAMIFGPVVALIAAAVSDTLGAFLFPSGGMPYFFPFIFVEMTGSLIFALFLWRTKLSAWRVILSRFSVVVICNLILNSALMIPYMRIFYGKEYSFFTITRMVKNTCLFPVEATLLVIFLSAILPILQNTGFVTKKHPKIYLDKRHYITIGLMTVVSVGILLVYIFRLS